MYSTACSLVAGLITFRLFRNHLSLGEFVVFQTALQLSMYLPLLDGGVRTLMNGRLLGLPEGPEKSQLIVFGQRFYSWFVLLLGAVIGAVMLGFSLTPTARGAAEGTPFYLVLGVAFTMVFAASAQGALLMGLRAQNTYYWILGTALLINLAALAGGLAAGLGLWAFPLAYLVMFLASWPFYVAVLRAKAAEYRTFDWALPKEFWERWRSLRQDAFASFRTQVAMFFLYTADILTVGFLLPPEQAAAYILLVRVLIIVRGFIQSLGEVSWPMMAENREESPAWSHLLLRANAWIYGSMVGAMAVTLLPFLHWYMGAAWTAATPVFALLLVRYVINGIQNPAGYFLIGHGQFRTLARWTELELIVGAVLAYGLIRAGYGANGVAGAFLAASVCGTLYPVIRSYARSAGFSPAGILATIWSRTITACAASAGVAWLLRPWMPGPWIVVASAVAALAGLAVGAGFGWLRRRRLGGSGWRQLLRAI